MLNISLALALFLVVFIIVWVTYGRDWVATTQRGARFLAWIEPFEIALYKKSNTILWARFKMLTGALLTLMTQMGEIDITPLLPLLSEKWRGPVQVGFNFLPLTITLMGMIDEQQRNNTTKPVEIVALPNAVLAEPEVAQAVAHVEIAQANAKVVAVEKKAEIKVAAVAEKVEAEKQTKLAQIEAVTKSE